jgi:hypothetical protein
VKRVQSADGAIPSTIPLPAILLEYRVWLSMVGSSFVRSSAVNSNSEKQSLSVYQMDAFELVCRLHKVTSVPILQRSDASHAHWEINVCVRCQAQGYLYGVKDKAVRSFDGIDNESAEPLSLLGPAEMDRASHRGTEQTWMWQASTGTSSTPGVDGLSALINFSEGRFDLPRNFSEVNSGKTAFPELSSRSLVCSQVR